MPASHLLGKKSWNVYNTANIEKVRRDEAAARAKEEEEEQQMQEVDAQRRLQILRGEQPAPITEPLTSSNKAVTERSNTSGRERKRRRIGEDDTDRDIRIAAATRPENDPNKRSLQRPNSDAPLTDCKGHINLFPAAARQKPEKNAEAEAEKVKKQREYEDQYTMRFSNAAGFKQAIGANPWYEAGSITSGSKTGEVTHVSVGKDVWGNEDKGREERAKRRLQSDDPLIALKSGVKQFKKVESERKKIQEARWRRVEEIQKQELRQARSLERTRRKQRTASRSESIGLEGFSLDGLLEIQSERREGHHQTREATRPDSGKVGEQHTRGRRDQFSPGLDDEEWRREEQRRDKDKTGRLQPKRKRHHRVSSRREDDESDHRWTTGPGGRYSKQFME